MKTRFPFLLTVLLFFFSSVLAQSPSSISEVLSEGWPQQVRGLTSDPTYRKKAINEFQKRKQEGIRLHQAGKDMEAMEMFRWALHSYADGECYYYLGLSLLNIGMNTESAVAFGIADKEGFGDYTGIYLNRARAYGAARDFPHTCGLLETLVVNGIRWDNAHLQERYFDWLEESPEWKTEVTRLAKLWDWAGQYAGGLSADKRVSPEMYDRWKNEYREIYENGPAGYRAVHYGLDNGKFRELETVFFYPGGQFKMKNIPLCPGANQQPDEVAGVWTWGKSKIKIWLVEESGVLIESPSGSSNRALYHSKVTGSLQYDWAEMLAHKRNYFRYRFIDPASSGNEERYFIEKI